MMLLLLLAFDKRLLLSGGGGGRGAPGNDVVLVLVLGGGGARRRRHGEEDVGGGRGASLEGLEADHGRCELGFPILNDGLELDDSVALLLPGRSRRLAVSLAPLLAAPSGGLFLRHGYTGLVFFLRLLGGNALLGLGGRRVLDTGAGTVGRNRF